MMTPGTIALTARKAVWIIHLKQIDFGKNYGTLSNDASFIGDVNVPCLILGAAHNNESMYFGTGTWYKVLVNDKVGWTFEINLKEL